MIIDLPGGGRAKLVGDPHIGRKFDTGVPLHRRGDREKQQFAKFVDALNTPDVTINVMVGDLFEHPYVGHATVVQVAEAYIGISNARPNTTFIAMAGNHDRPRALDLRGAWDSFVAIVRDRSTNLHTVDRPRIYGALLLLPWEWGCTAAEQIAWLEENCGRLPPVAIGHYDLRSYGGDDSHIYPTKPLAGLGVQQFFGGHYHQAGLYEIGGYSVTCTGSLEPYSHGEDADEEIYVTRPLADVLADPAAYKDKCVRVILAPGEELPSNLDCLAITPLKTLGESVEIHDIDVGGFDWEATLARELATVGDQEVVGFIKDRL